MRRPTDLIGLLWLAVRHRRRWIAAVAVALFAGSAAGWLLAPRSEVDIERERAPKMFGAVDGVVLVDRPPLRAGRIVRVLAMSSLPSVLAGDARFREVLVGSDWISGEIIALRAEPEDPLRGTYVPMADVDLDGDGTRDRLWHAVRPSVEADTERPRLDGYLVFEGSRGVRVLPLASSDGWGSEARFDSATLRDVVGTPEPDLLAVLDTDTCEVGPTGHRLVVVTFGSGEPVMAVEHDVNEPSLVGLTQYQVGSVRVSGREIVARTVVLDPRRTPEAGVHVRVDRWSGGEHTTHDEPLRTLDGDIVTAVTAGPLGPDEPPPLFWIHGEREPRELASVRLAEEPYARALREWGTEELDWHDWVALD